MLGRHVERLEFLDVLLGDRPALTPVENFYQRMLAGDPDEALDQAEQLLKERSLSSYYDEVALKGLQLAANDAAPRRRSRPAQIERIKDAIQGAGRRTSRPVRTTGAAEGRRTTGGAGRDADPRRAGAAEGARPAGTRRRPPTQLPESWRGEAPVLCIAGRGPLDEAAVGDAGAAAAQARPRRSRRAARGGLARAASAISTLTGVAMVCISYLEISGNPAHLRYLLRRLHQRLPGIADPGRPLAGRGDGADGRSARREVGADVYVSSLREASKPAWRGLARCLRRRRLLPETLGNSVEAAALRRVRQPKDRHINTKPRRIIASRMTLPKALLWGRACQARKVPARRLRTMMRQTCLMLTRRQAPGFELHGNFREFRRPQVAVRLVVIRLAIRASVLVHDCEVADTSPMLAWSVVVSQPTRHSSDVLPVGQVRPLPDVVRHAHRPVLLGDLQLHLRQPQR